jgi:hypothetical protein
MCQEVIKRELIRDPSIAPLLMAPKAPKGSPREYVRAFSWFSNESVPSWAQPLLKSYVSSVTPLLRDPRDVIFVTHILL